jgi:hypothetical protein
MACKIKAFSVGLHQTKLNAVMDNLDEVSRSHRLDASPTFVRSRSQCLKNRTQPLDYFFIPSDHQAVAFCQPPNTATGTSIHIGDALWFEHRSAEDIVLVECVAAVNDGIAGCEQAGQFVDHCLGCSPRWNHHPDCARRGQCGDRFRGRKSRDKPMFSCQLAGHLWGMVDANHAIAALKQTLNYIPVHFSQSNHSEFQKCFSLFLIALYAPHCISRLQFLTNDSCVLY